MNFAVIDDGLVVNLIVAESKSIAEQLTNKTCVDYTALQQGSLPHVGLGYSNGVFEQPVKEPITMTPEEYLASLE